MRSQKSAFVVWYGHEYSDVAFSFNDRQILSIVTCRTGNNWVRIVVATIISAIKLALIHVRIHHRLWMHALR